MRKIETTKVFDKLCKHYMSDKEIIILQGGARSSKTHTILQLLYTIAKNSKKKRIISIVGGTLPKLRMGAHRQFIEKIVDSEINFIGENKSTLTYKVRNSIIEFFQADNAEKARGPERDILFINEVNVGISKQTFEQLEMRTTEKTIVDFNPETKFYITEEVAKQNNAILFISTYKDNPFLPQKVIDGIERLKQTNPEAWRVYGLGLIGQYEGLVFKNTEIKNLSSVKHKFKNLNFGLDFGFEPDPMAFVITAKHGENIYILKELVMCELSNREIAEMIKPYCDKNVVWCDGAEKKSIAELRRYGINARSADKRDRKYRLNWLKSHKIIIDKNCKTTIEEMESFSRLKDKNGEIIPVFQDGNDHCIDAISYSFTKIMLQRGKLSSKQIPGVL